jgi:trimeric autotransporter adhesin
MKPRVFRLFGLAAVVLCWAGAAFATSYVYDPAGRLVAEIASDGSSAVYAYDSNGNITSIQRLLASSLAIFAFTPEQGASGQQVTIQGSGFSTTPTNNTVKFNGVAAAVVSATVNLIVATVPSAATTGTISVSVGGSTVTSNQTFTVLKPPTISGFTPAVINIGSSVTLTGTNFNPVAGGTSIRMAGDSTNISSLTATQAVFAVFTPEAGGSGAIQITTPYGQAVSTTDLIVAPSALGAANVISSKTLVVSAGSTSLNISQRNKYGVFAFDATEGQWLSVQVSELTTSPSHGQVSYQVYSPAYGLIASGWVSSSNMSIHLPPITVSGTYLIAFNAANETAQLTALLENDATLSLNATALTITTANAGQSKRVLFSATSDQTAVIYANSIVTTPANIGMYFTVYDSTGAAVTSTGGQPSVTVNLPQLVGGNYTVLISGFNGSTEASATGQVSLVSGVAGVLSANGVGANYATTEPAQIGYFSFTATAGQSVGLGLTQLAITPNPNGYLYVPVSNPDGSFLIDGYCYTTDPGCQFSYVNLPQTGTYTLTLDPQAQSTMSFTLTLSQDVSGTLAANTPLNVSLPATGQNALLYFSASPGQSVTLTVDSIVTTPANVGVSVSVYNSTGTLISNGAGQPTVVVSLPNLAADTYNVLIAPAYGATASVRVTIQ